MLTENKEEKAISFLEGLLGSDRVSTSVFEKIKQSLDPMPYRARQEGLPIGIALPETTREVSEIMRFANKERISVFVRGSGTQLAGSSRPHLPGIVINTSRLNHFTINEEYGFFESGPGVRAADAADMLDEKGWFLPMWPGSKVIASLGGLISNNTAGHLIDAAIGRIADYVYGLEVVLPDGEIIETGSWGQRKAAGTDLTKMFVGGDGLMGVITRIRMRLLPAPQKSYGIAVFDDLKQIARGVKRMYLEKAPKPLMMEFMDHNTSKIGFEVKNMTPPSGSVIFFISTGQDQEAADKKMAKVMQVFKGENPVEARQISDTQEWEKIFEAREVITSYLMKAYEGKILLMELVANLADFEEAMIEGLNINRNVKYLENLTNYYFGHIGALTMHPSFIIPADTDDATMREISSLQFQKEAEFNAKYSSCGGEWGQFSKRTPFYKMRYGEKAYELVKHLKAVFDPNGILNPGILEGYR